MMREWRIKKEVWMKEWSWWKNEKERLKSEERMKYERTKGEIWRNEKIMKSKWIKNQWRLKTTKT